VVLAAITPGTAPDVTTAAAAEVDAEDFGCSAIGEHCNGKDSNCCSGRCEGEAAQKGKKKKGGKKHGKNNRRTKDKPDRSSCEAHNEGGCNSSQDTCANQATIACGRQGACYQTTGNAPFCGLRTFGQAPSFACTSCNTDQDCVNLGYGNNAACVVCPWQCQLSNSNKSTACVGSAD
jgi:hypothetical protein